MCHSNLPHYHSAGRDCEVQSKPQSKEKKPAKQTAMHLHTAGVFTCMLSVGVFVCVSCQPVAFFVFDLWSSGMECKLTVLDYAFSKDDHE